MKSYFKLAGDAGVGSAIALAIYSAVTCLLVYAEINLLSLVVNSVLGGALFGFVFAAVHARLTPTPLSSILTGAAFIAAITLISLFVAGTFVGWSVAAVVAMVMAALSIGLGGYATHRFFR